MATPNNNYNSTTTTTAVAADNSDAITVDSWGGATQGTAVTVGLVPHEDNDEVYVCPKHPDFTAEQKHAICPSCEAEFQQQRQSLRERRDSVTQQLQELSNDNTSAGDILQDLQRSMQQWKPSNDQEESNTSLPPRYPTTANPNPAVPAAAPATMPPPAPPPNPFAAPPTPPPSTASSTPTSTPGLDALTMQIQGMQRMQDWMLWQKEQECQQLRQRLEESVAESNQFRVENALLQEKLHQQEQRMQHELKLIKLAALRTKKEKNLPQPIVSPSPTELQQQQQETTTATPKNTSTTWNTHSTTTRSSNNNSTSPVSTNDFHPAGFPTTTTATSPKNSHKTTTTANPWTSQTLPHNNSTSPESTNDFHPAGFTATTTATSPKNSHKTTTTTTTNTWTSQTSPRNASLLAAPPPPTPRTPPTPKNSVAGSMDDTKSADTSTEEWSSSASVPRKALPAVMPRINAWNKATTGQQEKAPVPEPPKTEKNLPPKPTTPVTASDEDDSYEHVVPQDINVDGEAPPAVPLEENITFGTTMAAAAAAASSTTPTPKTTNQKRSSDGVVPTTTPASKVSFVDDSASVGQTVASSTYGEDRQKVVSQSILDPYGDKGQYTGIILRSTGMPHGQGRMLYQEDKRTYDGEWRHGRWHGFGRATFANGDSYEGEYRFDQRHGRGRYEWHDGRVYDGNFREDKRHGYGTFTWPDGAVYEGDFKNGQREGHGMYQFSDGGKYEGSWKDGRYNGFGICHWEDGRTYKGEWMNGMAHGKGVETFADGSVRHDGQWIEDEPVLLNEV